FIAGLLRFDQNRHALYERDERRRETRDPERNRLRLWHVAHDVASLVDSLARRDVAPGCVHVRLVMVVDHAAAAWAFHECLARGFERRRLQRIAQEIEARHEVVAAMRTRPAPVMPRALLPELPDRAF